MMLILSVKNLLIVLLFVLISSISIPQNNRKTDSNAALFSQGDDSTKIILYKELAWSLRNKEPLESIKYGTEALQLSESLNDSNQLASVYNYLGVFRNKMSKYAEALSYYYKALKIAVLIDNKTETGYAYNNIGEIYALQNNDSLAAINFQKALSSFQEVNNSKGIAYCYTMLGEIESRKGNFTNALNYFFESINIAVKNNDLIVMATRYRKIGNVFLSKKDYISAVSYYLKALDISEKHQQKLEIAEAYYLLGKVHIEIGNYKIAEVYLDNAFNISKELNALKIQYNAANEIKKLYYMQNDLKNALKQTGYIDGSKDGMDMALCIINKRTKELQFAGANRPAYIFRQHKIEQLAFTENPIGIDFRELSFQNQIIKLDENDKIYLFTDGYADQFGGSEDKKYMIRQLINLIEEIHEKPMAQQKMILDKTLDDWMNHIKPSGEYFKQVDDILVLGVTI